MNSSLSEKEAIFRFAKIFIGQYLSSVHNFESFQEEALNLLTIYLIRMIKGLALKVKGLLNLQGRNLPNPLHLLVVADMMGSYNFEDILQFILKSRELKIDAKSLDKVQRLGKIIFQNDIESINSYPKETENPNIQYIPPVYMFDTNKHCLPYRHPIDEVIPLPPEVTYQHTKQNIIKEKKNIEHLTAYTRRQNRIAMVGRMLEEEKIKSKLQKEKQIKEVVDNDQIEEVYGILPQKKPKFDLISYV